MAATATLGSASDTHSLTGSVYKTYGHTDVAFEWVDASVGGTKLSLGDDAATSVALPFAFTYFGTQYTSVQVGSNGYLVFGPSDATTYRNQPIPTSAQPNGVVAALWDDLDPSLGGAVWRRTVGTAPNRRFVVAWVNVPGFASYTRDGGSFEVILEEASGDLVFQYKDVDFGDTVWSSYGASATVGLERAAGSVGAPFSHDEPVLDAYESAKGLRWSYGTASTPTPPDRTPPLAPTGLTAVGGELKVTLDWADNAEADLRQYKLYRSTDGATWTTVASPATSAHTDTAVTAGTAYSYRVTAVDASGNESGASVVATATPTADVTAPAAPTGLVATAGVGQVALNWADSGASDLARYRVYRSADGTTWANVASPTASAYTDTAVTNGTTYSYRVTALDQAGNESGASAIVAATPRAAPTFVAAVPSAFVVVGGSHSAGSLASLRADDGNRLEVSRTGAAGADFYAVLSLGTQSAAAGRLAVEWDGHATRTDALLTFYAWNWRTSTWNTVSSRAPTRSDAVFRWQPASAAEYVSPSGEVRFGIRGTRDGALKTRTDLIRATAEF